MTIPELAQLLGKLGCPQEKSGAMASQLDKRACMDAERKGVSYEVALKHLIELMAQGWAAQAKQPHPRRSVAQTEGFGVGSHRLIGAFAIPRRYR